MSETMALAIQLIFFVLAVSGTGASVVVYWLSDGEHGGITGLILGIIAFSIGSSLYDASMGVLS